MRYGVNIEKDVCKGCSLCVAFCPVKILEIDEKNINKSGYNPATVKQDGVCIGCMSCVRMCPDSAIELERNAND